MYLQSGTEFKQFITEFGICFVLITMMVVINVRTSVTTTGTIGSEGASWTLYNNGVLEVGEGLIHWIGATSPWIGYSDDINQDFFHEFDHSRKFIKVACFIIQRT